ncbi:hypothetical protein PENTCL1PPCAC_729, partial [Pristionchus entomophagus]
VFFEIDGESSVRIFRNNETSLSLQVKNTSSFFIDPQYDRLYMVFYEGTPQFKNISFALFLQLVRVQAKENRCLLDSSKVF